MSGEAVAQSVRMDLIAESGARRCLAASRPDHLFGDRLLTGVPAVAGQQPDFWFLAKSAHVSPKLLQQNRTAHDIAIFTAFSTFNVYDHSFPIDVRHF